MKNKWTILAASAIGSAHVKVGTPCQDYCLVRELGNGWGVAAVADGAGSCENSHIGSRFTCWEAVHVFGEMAIAEGWPTQKTLPSDANWQCLSKNGLNRIRLRLHEVAKHEGVEFRSLSSTVIMAIFSPVGICVAHVGDGRAGYKGQNGGWDYMITPHSGCCANETVFLTSQWEGNGLQSNDMKIPESRVIREEPAAFVMMSDGCEFHSFSINLKVNGKELYTDPNTPHQGFFDPLLKNIKAFNGNEKAIQQSWQHFLTDGTPGLANERDDKTMILGIINQGQ